MKRPGMPDEQGNPCFLGLKRGRTTDVTNGIGNEIFSYTRNHLPNSPPLTAKEWPIIYYSTGTEPFSAEGDSGAAVFDVRGRMGGLITAGVDKSTLRQGLTSPTSANGSITSTHASYVKKPVNLIVEKK
jgi:hypothetical protein